MSTSVVFVDTRVADYQTLIDGLEPGSDVYLIDEFSDGLDQIVARLHARTGIDALHIISHGSQGAVYLGNTVLNNGNLSDYQSQLASIGGSLTDTGDILLYGCNVAQGDVGVQFISSLAQATGADVAGSDDFTGTQSLNTDWVLEKSVGIVESQSEKFGESYAGTLSSEALITADGKQYTIPVLAPIGSGSTPQSLAANFYVKEGNVLVEPNQTVLAELMAASQSLFILQAFDYGNSNSTLWDEIVFANSRLVQLKENIQNEVIVVNAVNCLVMTATAGIACAITGGAVLPVVLGLVADMAFSSPEIYLEWNAATKKRASLEIGNDFLIQAQQALRHFQGASYANIFNDVTTAYGVAEIQDAIKNAMLATAAVRIADTFIKYVASVEDQMDWTDTWLDAIGTLPGLDQWGKKVEAVGDAVEWVVNFTSLVRSSLEAAATPDQLSAALMRIVSEYQSVYDNPFNTFGSYAESITASSIFSLKGTAVADTMRIDDPAGGTLDALAGSDTLIGSTGNDILKGGGDSDTYRYSGAWGQDLIIDSGAGNIVQLSDVTANQFIGYEIHKLGKDMLIVRNDESIRIQNFFTYTTEKPMSEITSGDYSAWSFSGSGWTTTAENLVNRIPTTEFLIQYLHDGTFESVPLVHSKTITINENNIGNIAPGQSVPVQNLFTLSGGTLSDFDAVLFVDKTSTSTSGYFDRTAMQGKSYVVLTTTGYEKLENGLNNSTDNPNAWQYWDEFFGSYDDEWADASYIGGYGSNSIEIAPMVFDGLPSGGRSAAIYDYWDLDDTRIKFAIHSTRQPNSAPSLAISNQSARGYEQDFGLQMTAVDANTTDSLTVNLKVDSTNGSSGILYFAGNALAVNQSQAIAANLIDDSLFSFSGVTKGQVFSLSAEVSDGQSSSGWKNFSLTIANSVPALANDSLLATNGEPLMTPVSQLLGNDLDRDGDTLTVVSVGSALHGSVSLFNGLITYTPAADWLGNDSFSYSVSDGSASVSATATVRTVPKPVTLNDSASTAIGQPVTIYVLINDTAPLGTQLSVSAVTQSTHGLITTSADASAVIYTPFEGFSGEDSFVYFAQSSDGAIASSTVTVTVASVNHTPTFVSYPTSISFTDTSIDDPFNEPTSASSGTLIGSDADTTDTLTFGISGGTFDGTFVSKVGTFGTLTVQKITGSYSFTPNDAAIEARKTNASEIFTLTLTDGSATDNETCTVNVFGSNDSADFYDTSGTVSEDNVLTTQGTLTVSDRDTGDAVIIAQTNKAGTYGTFNIATNGTWNYALNNTAANVQALVSGQTASDSFSVTTAGGESTDVVISIAGANDVANPYTLTDFNTDSTSDILWRNTTTGQNVLWHSASANQSLGITAVGDPAHWKILATADFNGDTTADILWRNTSTGANAIWSGGNSAQTQPVVSVGDTNYKIVGVGDFNGDKNADILWRNSSPESTSSGAVPMPSSPELSSALVTPVGLLPALETSMETPRQMFCGETPAQVPTSSGNPETPYSPRVSRLLAIPTGKLLASVTSMETPRQTSFGGTPAQASTPFGKAAIAIKASP